MHAISDFRDLPCHTLHSAGTIQLNHGWTRIDTDAQSEPCRCVRILGGHRSVAFRISNGGWFSPLYSCPSVLFFSWFWLSGPPPVGELGLPPQGRFRGSSRIVLESCSNRPRLHLESAPGKSPRESRQSCRNLGRPDRIGPLNAGRTGAFRGLRLRLTGRLCPVRRFGKNRGAKAGDSRKRP